MSLLKPLFEGCPIFGFLVGRFSLTPHSAINLKHSSSLYEVVRYIDYLLWGVGDPGMISHVNGILYLLHQLFERLVWVPGLLHLHVISFQIVSGDISVGFIQMA